ncbi:MAG: molybdopterin molybdenumtransferase MoeA [Bacteroidia bacterium]|nr:MAG: molybdopterin molybdenumtransferase MoeA [Bacteroidia bacterium]PIE86502.1 MAG: molybdopterin molybdenumtransferase MoeA [Bacteroidia bacterium]
MIPLEEALEKVKSVKVNISTQRVKLTNSLNRVLAEDIVSDMDMPPFDKATMDGYACKREDIHDILEVIEHIPAGSQAKKTIKKKQCAKIMTGGMLPEGADCVIIVEDTKEIEENKIIFNREHTKTNICFKGEDLKTGNLVLSTGTIIKPQHIAELASVGAVNLKVAVRPRIGVISTGNEIVEPQTKPGLSQIRNSNAYQILAQIKQVGATANYIGIVKDTEKATSEAIEKALNKNDILISTGAVSMGDFDLIPVVLKKMGFTIHFHRIAVKPGKPTLFAQLGNKFFFGLPGNPVSSFVQFHLLAKELIYKTMNANYKPQVFQLPFAVEYRRNESTRKAWIPVTIRPDGFAKPIDYHGSAHIYSLTAADGIVSIEIGKNTIKEGELVDVRPL